MKNIIFAFVIMCLFNISCSPELEFDVDVPNNISSTFLLQNGQVWNPIITKVKAATDSLYYEPVSNTDISVTTDKVVFNEFTQQFGGTEYLPRYIYSGAIPNIEQGSICDLLITNTNYPDVTAHDTMPQYINILDIELQDLTVTKIPRNERRKNVKANIIVSLDQALSEFKYLLIEIKVKSDLYQEPYIIDGVAFYRDSTYYRRGFFSIENTDLLYGAFNATTIEDGSGNQLDITISNSFVSSSDSTVLEFKISTISNTYYSYLESLESSISNNTDFFAETTTAFNNLDGGYGVFALANTRSFTFEIK